MVDFNAYKENKERERKEKWDAVNEAFDEEMKNYDALIKRGDMIVESGQKPTYEFIDEIVGSMLKIDGYMKELHSLSSKNKDEKVGLDLIAEGAYEMMEESKPHIVK